MLAAAAPPQPLARQFASAFAALTVIGWAKTVWLGEPGELALTGGLTWGEGVASAFTDWSFDPKVEEAAVTIGPPGPALTKRVSAEIAAEPNEVAS